MKLPKDLARRVKIKCILIGDSSVGKTSLLNQYVFSEFSEGGESKVTMQKNILHKEIPMPEHECVAVLELWDTRGQEGLQSCRKEFFDDVAVCVFVYDQSKHTSFENVNEWVEEFVFKVGKNSAKNAIILLAGNKSDLESEISNKEIETIKNNLAQVTDTVRPVQYFETSAKANVNVDALFTAAVKTYLNKA